ncbi:transducin beta-like protein 3 isoform X2 [Gigantopelta aegis]|uniref:transducin beta-like protein 3 isoform X2 n=1 Tax=Gigantopelta aegis TaxID=1735272 RepID=UPI001B88CAFC|nr:transducin beta-like protein 3 isoform X2 [Gigantopelta aegis]
MSQFKSSFAVSFKYEACYTGGRVQISRDGSSVFCGCGNKVQIVDYKSGRIQQAVGKEEDEEISCFCLSPDDKFLIIATHNLLLRQWDWKEKKLLWTWRIIHVSPISCMTFDTTSSLLATGGSDSTIKMWDITKQYCTHNLRGHEGVVSVVSFNPDMDRLQLVSAADDYKVRVWDLRTSSCVAVVDAHYSRITALVFSQDGTHMYSGGRDSIIAVWSMKKVKVTKTIPVFESVESLVLLDSEREYKFIDTQDDAQPHVVVVGNKGALRVINTVTGTCVHEQSCIRSADRDGDQTITDIIYSDSLRQLAVVTFDHDILFYRDEDLTLQKQLSGFIDEILDVKFLGETDSHLVVISNSNKLKVFEVDTWDCQILAGHTDIILSADVCHKFGLIVTSSKDNTVRLWKLLPDTGRVVCVAVGCGHTHAVGTVAFSRKSTTFLVSGGQDSTLKKWLLPSELDTDVVTSLPVLATERAHEKDINSVVVSPNDKFVATGSQDRTAKLFKSSDLSLIGVFRGHRRGIWCVQFSPVDQCLATSSADGTIKIWSIIDFSCVKTFEGHDSSVLRVSFITRGMQLVSCGSDGLVKLWTIKLSECIKTFDEHSAKVWALAVGRQEDRLVTGGADSTLVIWKDVTETEIEETKQKQQEMILQEQELSNLIHKKKFLKAIGLAITLEQPFRLLTILRDILSEKDGSTQVKNVLSQLRPDQTDSLLRFAIQWNTNSKNCHVAQFVVGVVLKTVESSDIQQLPNIKSTLEGLIPYTERHFQRMNRLLQQAMFVEYTWQCMRTAGDQVEDPSKKVILHDKEKTTKRDRSRENGVDKDITTETLSSKKVKSRHKSD